MKTVALAAGLSLSLFSFTQSDITVEPFETTTTNKAVTVNSNNTNALSSGVRRVNAYSRYTTYFQFEGGRRAEVTINGDGDCDLDLYIYNLDGYLVAKDDDDTDYCVASWVPNRTKTYKVVIVNRSGVYANFELDTN